NGYFNGSVASKIEFNGKILNVESNTSDDKFLFDYSNDLFVFAGAGEFEQSIPLVYVTVAISDDEMNLNNVTFNDNLVANQNYKLPVENSIVGSDLLLQNTPNPFTSNTNITLNIAQEGNYTLTVYDLSGNRLNVLANEYLTAGQYSYQFDGTDSYGNQLSNGMYIYKLTGNNTSVSMKMLLNR
nr:T9SS type A sorting domain-containing protein [Candidatus Kapabacteria bacterium]